MKTITEQLKCARRESAMRKNCYPKWLRDGRTRMNAQQVQHEIDCMDAIVETLEKMQALEEVSEEMKQGEML